MVARQNYRHSYCCPVAPTCTPYDVPLHTEQPITYSSNPNTMRIYIILPLAISSLHVSRDGSIHFAHAAERLEASASGLGKEAQFQDILEKMKNDVLLFRDEVERVYSSRCDASTLENCAYNNYNSCSSTFPQQQCMKADELVISACGDGQSCNGELNEYIRLLLL